MPIICNFLGSIVTGILTPALSSLKINREHAHILGLWDAMYEVGTPPPHNPGMVLIPVAGNTHIHTFINIHDITRQ